MDNLLGDRKISVARELTKLHEEIFRGSIKEALDHYKENPPKGEFTLVLAGADKGSKWDQGRLLDQIKTMIETGKVSPSKLAKELAKETGWSRRDIYDLIQGLLGGDGESNK
jgi:16S rRNA (cytidine1402-2'-O)-methyltransferase